VHSTSGINEPLPEPLGEARAVPGMPSRTARRALSALLCAIAILAAGCHGNNQTSGYGIAWVTLTGGPSDFTSYVVNVDQIQLTRNDGAIVPALATPETVDFTKLNNVSELWGSATVPSGTYVSASITLDYTPLASGGSSVISVMVNGLPQKATVVDAAGAAVTTQTINVTLDPANQLPIAATYATTSAVRLALGFNLAASTASINTATSPVTVTIKPYMTVGVAPPDTKLIRVRGPLINSSVSLGTYTVYERPFFDDQNVLGSLSLFVDTNTLYTINGSVFSGTPGITQLSQSSAGSTMTAAYATLEPTPTPNATAGIFHAQYVIAGSTLQDIYTAGLEGDVVARSGNTLTVRGATLQQYLQIPIYAGCVPGAVTCNETDATVIVGPSTTVTADDTLLTGLDYNAVAVGQHIIARGIYTAPSAGVVDFDARSTTTNTGSVRLISTQLFGSLNSAATPGSLLLNLGTINNWPVTDYSFAGNGTSAAADPVAANFSVNSGALAIPDTTAVNALWIDGRFAPFGSAPPDFIASTVNNELGVQTAGQTAATAAAAPSSTNPTPFSCALGNLDCVPASMQVAWTSPGTTTPFSGLTSSPITVDLTNASSAVIRIGSESINLMAGTPVNPQIIPTAALAPVTANAGVAGSTTVTLPPVFLPAYSYGIPSTSTTVVASTGLPPPNNSISVFSGFAAFATGLTTALATTPALQLEARGTYDRAANTFYLLSVDVVL
jgi:hypothetical protein